MTSLNNQCSFQIHDTISSTGKKARVVLLGVQVFIHNPYSHPSHTFTHKSFIYKKTILYHYRITGLLIVWRIHKNTMNVTPACVIPYDVLPSNNQPVNTTSEKRPLLDTQN